MKANTPIVARHRGDAAGRLLPESRAASRAVDVRRASTVLLSQCERGNAVALQVALALVVPLGRDHLSLVAS